jgi:hypothetical protein
MSACSARAFAPKGGRGRQDVRLLDDLEQVGRPAPGALHVIGVDGAPIDRAQEVGQLARLSHTVEVDGDSHVVRLGHQERRIEHRGSPARVLVDLQPARARRQHAL